MSDLPNNSGNAEAVSSTEGSAVRSNWQEALKGISGCLLPVAITAGVIILGVALFRGMGWIAESVLPWTSLATALALLVMVPLSLLLAVPRKTRAIGSIGLFLASYVIGIGLWVWCLLVAYSLAGVFWLVVGLFVAGIGVVPVAVVAALLNGEWLVSGQIAILAAIVYGLRFFSLYLTERVQRREAAESLAAIGDTLSDLDSTTRQLADRLNNLGLDYLRQGRSHDAIEEFEEAALELSGADDFNAEAIDRFRNSAMERAAMADASTFESKWSEIQQQRRFDLAKIHYNLANAYSKAARNAESVEALRQAIEFQPDSGLLRYALGLRAVIAGYADDALDQCEKLMELEDTGLAAQLLEFVKEHLSEGAAFMDDEECASLTRTLVDKKLHLAEAEVDWHSFLSRLEQSESTNQEHDSKYLDGIRSFEAGKKLFLENKHQEALDCFDDAIENGIDCQVYEMRAICLQALEFHLDAIDDFNTAIALSPEDANLWFMRSLSRSATGDIEGCGFDLENAVRLSEIDNEMNRDANEHSKEMGWISPTDLYNNHLFIQTNLPLPESLREKNREKYSARRKQSRP